MNGIEAARLGLLDGFRLEAGGRPVHVLASTQRLLALLALHGPVPRLVAAGTLWPDVPEPQALASLRTTIWRANRLLPGLVAAGEAKLGIGAFVSVDVDDLSEPGADRGLLRDRPGELLPGWYDDWVIFERERLRQLRLHTLEAFAQRLAEQRRFAAALDTALEAIRIEPLRESAHRVVIGIHLAEGNVVEAVRHYRFVRDLLREELGVEPSVQLTALLPARVRLAGPARVVTRLDMAR
jgi:DNA-binding SARP family transcriptional activator